MKEILYKLSLTLLLIGLVFIKLVAQPLTDSTIRKIDQLFDKWNKENTPGWVVGIIRNDSLIYAKGFGLSNLEDGTKNTPESIYYMCSLSKQFAGYAIALLIRQNKLKPDDDIRIYLPWLHDFKQKITIRHLLNHTSGIRDDIGLAVIKGLGMNGMLTHDYALKILKEQTTLNFQPGEKFSYSNSNYVLLAEIVKKVSGQTFVSFTDSSIFRPLGMKDTRFIDDPNELVKNRAASYSNNAGKFSNSYQNVYTLGDGGLFTNINDMSKWVMNFYNTQVGDQKDIELFTTKGILNNGKTINYAMGISSDLYKGETVYTHNGGLAGYRTILHVYPRLKTGFIIFGNASDNTVYNKPAQLADLLLFTQTQPETKPVSIVAPPTPTVMVDSTKAKQLAGIYLAENGFRLDFSFRKGNLYLNNTTLLAPDDDSTWYSVQRPELRFRFNYRDVSNGLTFLSPAIAEPIKLMRISEQQISPALLQSYTGRFYSAELDCGFSIIVRNNELFFTSSIHPDAKITLVGTDHLFSTYGFMKHVLVKRDHRKKIVGFTINTDATMGLYFKKVDNF